ncbi:unnamed protein product [Owenia fusiformis]|uniref:WSC domain-containing protein n=1 Tax=Owenia fusiformis TaxID=6347 RepID=A0A8S4NLC4_OWEFU|nr:unnamed protein product [Owenia fusiformis]
MWTIALGLLVLAKIAVSAPTDNVYLGCFKDEINRDLPYKAYEQNGNNTPSLCIETCAEAGYMYAAVTKGHKCFCGNSYGRYGSVAETECSMKCPGDRTQMCGAFLRLNIYKTSLAENPCGFTMSSDVSSPNVTHEFPIQTLRAFLVNTNDVPDYAAFLECCPNGPISVVADLSAFGCMSDLQGSSPYIGIQHGPPIKDESLCDTPEMTRQGPIRFLLTVRSPKEPITPWSVRFECAAE